MGLTFARATVSHGEHSATLNFLVDSGAQFTLVPHDTWRDLGLQARDREEFVLADGTRVERDPAECRLEFDGRQTTTWVILGEPDDDPLLGVYTLEGLRLVLNPFNRTLQPLRGRLA